LTTAISTTMVYIEQNPKDWTGYKNLALLYRDDNKIDLAKQAVEKALELAPEDQKAALQSLLSQLSANK
jgi:cytochrome c-type biogenesis protein CcmH/NrfG